MDRVTRPRTIEIDHVQPGRPCVDERPGCRARIGGEGRLRVEVPSLEAHDSPTEQIDGREDMELTR